MSLLVSDVQYGVWMCCRKIGNQARGCCQSRQHKIAGQGWLRCKKCDKVFSDQQETGDGIVKAGIYHRHLASNSCQFHPGQLQHRGGKLWLYDCCSGTPGQPAAPTSPPTIASDKSLLLASLHQSIAADLGKGTGAEGCRRGRHEGLDISALVARAADRRPHGSSLTSDALAEHVTAQSNAQDDGAQDDAASALCVQCLRFVGSEKSTCRFHAGVFNAQECARPRTMVPLAPCNIAVLVGFQRVQVVFHAPVPVGESGCTNPHLYAIQGRTATACGFAPISHYEVLVNGGNSARIAVDAGSERVQETLAIDGVFPHHLDGAHDTAADQLALDARDVRPPLSAGASSARLQQNGGADVGEAAKRVIESGGSAAVWHSIRLISKTKRTDAARPFEGLASRSLPPPRFALLPSSPDLLPSPLSPLPSALVARTLLCLRSERGEAMGRRGADCCPRALWRWSCSWRGDESEEIFFTVPEMSRPVIAVEHVSVSAGTRKQNYAAHAHSQLFIEAPAASIMLVHKQAAGR